MPAIRSARVSSNSPPFVLAASKSLRAETASAPSAVRVASSLCSALSAAERRSVTPSASWRSVRYCEGRPRQS
jgi:hypothetical protein